ncbi:MAG: N-glycosylase/DNA lyase [Thermofilum sp.]|uniref:N-glycosylase/DNA lyase n=1 Tax=Thermofilum pendens TaxID=2269 RepID=A0A7C4D1R6_THEPE
MKLSLFGDPERARRVGRALARSGLVEKLVSADPQMAAVEEILRKLGFKEGALFIVGVALVSYMLSRKGEEHWALAASSARAPYWEALTSFVENSPSLARLRRQRLARLSTYLEHAKRFESLLEAPEVDLDAFHSLLVRAMGSSADSKTAAFAAKMLLYSCLASGRRFTGGWSIPMPVDIRVALVSLTSGMVRGWNCSSDLLALASELRSRWRPKLISLWNLASEEAGTPPVVLDAAVWVPGGCIEEYLRTGSPLRRCVEQLVGSEEDYVAPLEELWGALSACGERAD